MGQPVADAQFATTNLRQEGTDDPLVSALLSWAEAPPQPKPEPEREPWEWLLAREAAERDWLERLGRAERDDDDRWWRRGRRRRR